MELSDFRIGDVILFHSPFKWYAPLSWLSALIRVFTKCRYNHVGVVILNWGQPFLNEAIETGVITIPLKDRLNGCDIRVIRMPERNVKLDKPFAIKANERLGHTGYDFSGLLFYQLIYQLTGHWLGHTGKAALGRMYCGEYTAYLYPQVFELWWKTAPSDIHKSDKFSTVFEGKYTIKK